MFQHDDYKRLQNLKNKLSVRFDRQATRINQDVYIRDLCVVPQILSKSYGEATDANSNYSTMDLMGRLVDHTLMLADIANEYHEKYNCDKDQDGMTTTKPSHLNHITRILTPEFFFYTLNPLPASAFQELLDQVTQIASKQHENVHLLLASFPLLTANKTLLNVCLYVQCGKEPVIEVFSKGRASSLDISYSGADNFSQEDTDPLTAKNEIHAFIAADKTLSLLVSNKSVFKVKTEGNAEYIQAIDICRDNGFMHSKKLLRQTARMDETGVQSLLPLQADHILTSNTTTAQNFASILASASDVIQVDPDNLDLLVDEKDSMTIAELLPCKKNKYTETGLNKINGGGFVVENPPFGHDFFVYPLVERKLSGFVREIQELINNHNEYVKQNTVAAGLEQVPLGAQFCRQEAEAERPAKALDLREQMTNLFDDLRKACASDFFEWLLGLPTYYLKNSILAEVNSSDEELKKLGDADQLKANYGTILDMLESIIKRLGNFPEDNKVISLIDRIDHTRFTLQDNIKRYHR